MIEYFVLKKKKIHVSSKGSNHSVNLEFVESHLRAIVPFFSD